MDMRKKKFFTCFMIITMLALAVQILGEDIPIFGRAISTTQATDSVYDYDMLKDNTLIISSYKGHEAEIVIPEKIDGLRVVGIGNTAFSENGNITKITIPKNIKSIGKGAFCLCTSLNEVILSDGIEKIDNEAFLGCTSLKNITIPDTVEIIGDYAFSGTGIVNIDIPSTVTKVGAYAFLNCYSLKNASLSGGMTKISNNMFSNCSTLESIDIPGSVGEIGALAFSNCISLNSVNMTQSIKSIGQYAFEKCSSLESISIPDSVTIIGISAFLDCTNLKSINLSKNIEIIRDSVFSGCIKLENIDIPDNVKIIGADSFSGCLALTKVDISDNVSAICDRAFMGCVMLKRVDIGDGTQIIGANAFRGCSTLKDIYIGKGTESIGTMAFYECYELINVTSKSKIIQVVGTDTFNLINPSCIITVPDGTMQMYTAIINPDINLLLGVVLIEEGTKVAMDFSENFVTDNIEDDKETQVADDAIPKTDVPDESLVTVSPAPMATSAPISASPSVTALPVSASPFATDSPSSQVQIQYSVIYKDSDSTTVNTLIKNQHEVINLGSMPEKNGYSFVGWGTKADGNYQLLRPDSEWTVSADTEFIAVYAGIYMLDGASIKLSTPTGMRFTSRVDNESFDALAKYAKDCQYGTIVCPSTYLVDIEELTKGQLEANAKQYVDIIVKSWFASTDTYKEFTGVMTGMKETSYNKNYSARAYIRVTYADGSIVYYYSKYNPKNNSRSVCDVAHAALNDTNVYTQAQRAILQTFIDAVEYK